MTYYVTNKELVEQITLSKKQGRMSEQLGGMLMQMAKEISRKHNFVQYSYKDDLCSSAMVQLCSSWNKFDTKRDNAFGFYTKAIINSFKTYLKYEGKHQDIRDKSLIYAGQDPSETFERDL